MFTEQQAIHRSRLGSILVKRAYISQPQLIEALTYQAKRKIKLGTALVELKLISRRQLNFALRRQSWTRAIATSIAIACAPFSTAFASETPRPTNIVNSKSLNNNQAYSNNLFFATTRIDQQSKDFYYTGKEVTGFTLNKSISHTSGLKLSLFSARVNSDESQQTYEFDPQISLFKSSSFTRSSRYSNSKISGRLDRYTNSIPVVYMLTLKGRCILENSGEETTMWSLDSARKGVQRKAELMFSVTKQF